MSHLVTMRRRIKAVQTIKKITSAMRLIARAFHTRMHKKHTTLTHYQEELTQTFDFLCAQYPDWNPTDILTTKKDIIEKRLFIIIGSQKGLCGTFNNDLVYWIDKYKQDLTQENTHLVLISKRLEEQCKKRKIPFYKSLPELTLTNLETVTDELYNLSFHTQHNYSMVKVISNQTEGFFKQTLHTQKLIPFSQAKTSPTHKKIADYHWNHDAHTILATCASLVLRNALYTTLFESLMAEQAARFISMDNATRNANSFLDTMQLQYNKARQAKITKELTELAGAFESSFT